MAFLTGLPVHFIRYYRPNASVEWVGPAPEPKTKLLLCEDSAGKGKTLLNCRNFLLSQGYTVSTLVVCKMPFAATTPEYSCFDWTNDDLQVLFPWNRYRINGESRADALPDHEYERTAWDMDGVFLNDIERNVYDEDIEAALIQRDNTPLAEYAPQVSSKDIVITSRPEIDRERTETWLRQFGIDVSVVLRDEGELDASPEFKAQWKGRKALELGYTHFVESSAEQALYIASMYPELRVTWFNRGKSTIPESVTWIFKRTTKIA
ncbi:hypothetical protein [Alicyclobacillus fastidiosus]|nr:hypothetical protein [Alicyclobacillus fastidiosus]